MKRKLITVMLFSLSLLVMSGCWDNIELSEQAFVLGIGADLTKDGDYLISAQIIIPSAMTNSGSGGGGGQGKSFFVKTGSGTTPSAAHNNLQSKISRRINMRQRQTIYIGERLAEYGMGDFMDLITRDLESQLRGDAFVVKGNQALDVLKISDPLESKSAVASLKMHDQIDTAANATLINFLITNASKSMSPSLPVLRIGKDQKTLQLAGSAIFDKHLKVVGFLNEDETQDKMWIVGNLSNRAVNVPISQGKGNVGLRITALKSNIRPIINQDKVKFQITLAGKADVRENNTQFDLTEPDKLEIVEHELDEYVKNHVSQLITKVQKEYGMDIFGLGDAVFNKNPNQWNKIRKKWKKEFREADVSVKVDVSIHLIGFTGSTESHRNEEKPEEK